MKILFAWSPAFLDENEQTYLVKSRLIGREYEDHFDFIEMLKKQNPNATTCWIYEITHRDDRTKIIRYAMDVETK